MICATCGRDNTLIQIGEVFWWDYSPPRPSPRPGPIRATVCDIPGNRNRTRADLEAEFIRAGMPILRWGE